MPLKLHLKGARQRALIVLTSIVLMTTGAGCMESETKSETKGVPATYQLEDVSISLKRHPGNIVGSRAKHINISGTGNSTLEQNGDSLSFKYSSQQLLTVINTLNNIRFFELPKYHNAKYSSFLKDDGTVGTTVLQMNDAASTTFCFSIPDYEKCVTYSSDIAPELEELAQRIFSEAVSLVKSGETER